MTSLRCGHSFYTASGNVSHHSSGDAIDIAAINDVPILGHQYEGGIAEQAIRRLMVLQGSVRPAQIISLRAFGANTGALSDHDDHIHVGFSPDGTGSQAALDGDVLPSVLDSLRSAGEPVVETRPSAFTFGR